MTIVSARYCNPAHDCAEVLTSDRGLVLVSAADRPALWAGLLVSGVEIVAFAAPAVPRTATALRLRYALNAEGVRAAWEAALASQSQSTRDYWQSEPDPPETSPKLRRIAAAASIDLAALYDRALAQ